MDGHRVASYRIRNETTDRMAKAIAEGSGCSKVYLFGSRARGDFRPDSDYDFYLVFKDGTDNIPDCVASARRELFERFHGASFDLVYHCESEFARYSSHFMSLENTVSKEGVLCHE